ncbi:MAG TPA: NUDIX domain-containing protein [Segetibacter sp.]|nr:NUDIX domain-containing protein [Segetibacter sp.]
MPEKIVAGGGIVENDEKKILFQFRRGKWDLPKGKLEENETIEACALREVEEETGLKDIRIGELVGITHHFYNENGKDIEKETHWFAMKISGAPTLVPQLEEDITELRWVGEEDLKDYLQNTFNNIVEIIGKYKNRTKS